MNLNDPDDLEHLIADVLIELHSEADAKKIAKRVARLKHGLPAEDEFSVICTWLGRCKILHKLDQRPAPIAADAEYQVPDILAVFDFTRGVTTTLIEVKSKKDRVLSFKPGYFWKLKNYANRLGFPLLIAWKYQSVWTLFDSNLMHVAKTNYNISIEDALKESLLGELAGDFNFVFEDDLAAVLSFKKVSLAERRRSANEIEEIWNTVIDDAYFLTPGNTERRNLPRSVQSLLMSMPSVASTSFTDTHIIETFSFTEKAYFAHMALAQILSGRQSDNSLVHWRNHLRLESPIIGISNFREAIKLALNENVVRYILDVHPNTLPDFMR